MQNNYLTEQDTIIKNEKLIADTFNNYFADITKTLKLKKHPNFDGQSLFSITDYFKNNESVIKMTTGPALLTHRTVAGWETFTIVGSSLLHAVI